MATPEGGREGGGDGDCQRDVYRIIQVLTPPSVFLAPANGCGGAYDASAVFQRR